MAREITGDKPPPGRPVDWSRFDTGTTWELKLGTDFTQDPEKAARAARQWGSYHRRSMTVRIIDDQTITVYIHPQK